MKKTFMLLSFLILLPTHAEILCSNETNNQTSPSSSLIAVVEKLDDCPKPTFAQFKQFCDDIGLGLPGPSGIYVQSFQYNYEKRLWDISCVKPNDSKEIAIQKVRVMWSKHKKDFICNESSFPILSGSLLKYAIHNNFSDLLETLLMTYEVDINFVDETDNKNVIDYINDEIRRLNPASTPPDTYVKKLMAYRDTLIEFGAKPSK